MKRKNSVKIIILEKKQTGYFEWMTDDKWGVYGKGWFGSRELAKDDARRFFAQFGIDVEFASKCREEK